MSELELMCESNEALRQILIKIRKEVSDIPLFLREPALTQRRDKALRAISEILEEAGI